MVLKMKKESKIIVFILLLVVAGRLMVAQIQQKREYQSGAEGEDREVDPDCRLSLNILEPTPTLTPILTNTPVSTNTPVPTNIPPANTPTPTSTSTILPPNFSNLACNFITLKDSEGIEVEKIKANTSVTVSAKTTARGVIQYVQLTGNHTRCADEGSSACQILTEGIGNLSVDFTPTQSGRYVFEVNVYSNDCQSLCTVGQHLYQNTAGDCRSASGWRLVVDCRSSADPVCSQCQNGLHCLKYLEVSP